MSKDTETVKEAIKQLRKNGWDIWTQEGIDRFSDSIDQFFQANPTLPVTLQNIYRAFEERKTEFRSLTPAQAKWYETAQANPELANQVANYLASTTGRPGSIAKDGDPLFENLFLLFNELQSRREFLTPQTIAAAKNRIDSRPGRLRRVPEPRRTEPKSPAAKAADQNRTGEYKPGQFIDPISKPEWVRRAEDRSAREAQEAAANPSDATLRSRAAAEAKREAESIKGSGSSHAETDQLQRIFVTTSTNEIDWPSTLAARQRMKAQFEKARAVRRFIR